MTETATRDRKSYVADHNYGPVRLTRLVSCEEALLKGTILGRDGVSGALVAYDGAVVTDPVAVLLEDVPQGVFTPDGENPPIPPDPVPAVVGFAGVYVARNMIGLDEAAQAAFEPLGIYFDDVVEDAAPG